MRGMNSASVDLIYLDPPFNSKVNYAAPIGSKAAGAAFKDTWTLTDVDVEWINLIEAKHPALYRVLLAAMTANDKSYLTYMAARLLEMHRLLKPTGSIYLHCDPTMSHYLKLVMDSIFGRKHFRNEITWVRTSGAKLSQHEPKIWGRSSDSILFYVKTNAVRVSPYRTLSAEESQKKFKYQDVRGRYFTSGLSLFRRPAHGPRPNLCYRWRGFENPHPSGWTMSKSRLEEEYKKGNVVILSKEKLERRKYEQDYPGEAAGSVWTDIPNLTGKDAELLGYPTQKPLSLLRRIIKASSNKGDVVLDPFCGCATACIAAEQEHRNWIGIDIASKAADLVERPRGCGTNSACSLSVPTERIFHSAPT